MGKLRKIVKKDKYRILLTEVLPYEVPIIFSNEGFYDFVSNEKDFKNSPTFLRDIFQLNKKPKIPFNYRIKKSANSHRTLSIMHPSNQLEFVNFYKDYDLLLIHLCNRSSISLRYPVQVASMFYDKHSIEEGIGIKGDEVDLENNEHQGHNEGVYSSSYFQYKKYDLIHKFYDSYEFIRLEKRFNTLSKFDISNCFNSIYTHSLAWAVKDKLFAKLHKDRKSFEKEFDDLMQSTNHRETNGIIIGPEVSRLFAEIILQKVDLNTVERLGYKNLKNKKDFEIRRYVDDYFVFTNSQADALQIQKVFQEELEKFKLYLNPSKSTCISNPFITSITLARKNIFKLLEGFFTEFNTKYLTIVESNESSIEPKLFNSRRTQNTSNNFILEIKCIIKSNNVDYDSISRIAFSTVKRNLIAIFSKLDLQKAHITLYGNVNQFILIVFDFLFFLYSMDCCVRITYVMTQLIVLTNRYLSNAPADIQDNFKKKVFDESILLIKKIKRDEKQLSIEVLNLLIALKDLGDEYLIEEKLLSEIIDLESVDNPLCYFRVVVLLYYIQDRKEYVQLKEKLVDYILELFETDPYVPEKAETTCLFFDLLSCPYIEQDSKDKIFDYFISYYYSDKQKPKNQKDIRNYISKRKWFVDWSENINLDFVLRKKELTTPY